MSRMRSIVVTGASGGLGTEVVRHLSSTYRCVALTRSLADLTDSASVRRALSRIVAEHGPPYALVHLAGGFAAGSLLDTNDETWSEMIATNLTAAFNVARETLAVMDRSAPGRIVAISSDAARIKGPGMAAYTISKSALNTLVEVLARELSATQITVNALLPTALDTPAMRATVAREQLVPLDRVAETIAFLLSDAASSITGALLPLSPR
jgi:NAD(P)-dependent dehydrogenase (short-subunit alcohol dehydrogenase family)